MYMINYSPKSQVSYEIEIETETENEILPKNKGKIRETGATKKIKIQANSPNCLSDCNSNTKIRRRNHSKNSDKKYASKSIGYGIKTDLKGIKSESNMDLKPAPSIHRFYSRDSKKSFSNIRSEIKNDEIKNNCFNKLIGKCRSRSINEIHNFPENQRLKNRSFTISKINSIPNNRNKLQIRAKSMLNQRNITCGNHLNFLYQEFFSKRQKLNEKIIKNKEKKELMEMVECTFRPKLSQLTNQEVN